MQNREIFCFFILENFELCILHKMICFCGLKFYTQKFDFCEKNKFFSERSLEVVNDKIYFTKQKTKGRPRLILNDEGKKTIEKLARIMCTDEEIANMLEVAIETLQAKHNIDAFMEYKKKGQSQGKASLRRMQFKAAENGNASLLIWLGKQYLGQTDKKSEIQTWQGEENNDN